MELFDLREDYLVDKDDGLKKLLTWFYNLVMQLEAIQQCGAEPYERSEARTTQRNGHKERSLKTRVGELILEKLPFRGRSFKSCIFDNYSRVELALTNVIAESYLQGVSTRRIREVVSHLGVERLSASTVSRIAKELDEKIAEFLKKPIERPMPYIFVDASYFKVRDGEYAQSVPRSCQKMTATWQTARLPLSRSREGSGPGKYPGGNRRTHHVSGEGARARARVC